MTPIAEVLYRGFLEAEYDLMAQLLRYAHVLEMHSEDEGMVSEVEDGIDALRDHHLHTAVLFYSRAVKDGDREHSRPLRPEARAFLDALKVIVADLERELVSEAA